MAFVYQGDADLEAKAKKGRNKFYVNIYSFLKTYRIK